MRDGSGGAELGERGGGRGEEAVGVKAVEERMSERREERKEREKERG